jgi:hypothetical protein
MYQMVHENSGPVSIHPDPGKPPGMGFHFTVTVHSVTLTSTSYATEQEALTARDAFEAELLGDERFAISPVVDEPAPNEDTQFAF